MIEISSLRPSRWSASSRAAIAASVASPRPQAARESRQAELRPHGELGQEGGVRDADEPDQRTGELTLTRLHRPEAEAVLVPVCGHPLVEGSGGRIDRPVQVPGHLGILVDRHHRELVLGSPPAQRQPSGELSSRGLSSWAESGRPMAAAI
jgi:hypothetical protein